MFVSFDYEYYFCEVIDVSESFERYLDDSDYFDILIDGFVCKREMIRKQLDDFWFSFGLF